MFPSFLLGMSDEGITCLPSRENIKRRIRKLRYNNDLVPPPNDANFMSILAILCKTLRQAQFLRCDTGPGMSLTISVVT